MKYDDKITVIAVPINHLPIVKANKIPLGSSCREIVVNIERIGGESGRTETV